MGRRVSVIDLCDPCEHAELPEALAMEEVVIAIDQQQAKRYLLCVHCNHHYAPFLEMLRTCGQLIEPAKVPEPVKPKPEKAKKPVQAAPAPKELEQAKAKAPVPVSKPAQYVICTLPHPTEDGGPKRIKYGDRGSHFDMCHPDASQFDIKWGDPDGILTVPCLAHAECMKVGFAFTSSVGMHTHVRGSTFQRIDLLEQDSDGHPH